MPKLKYRKKYVVTETSEFSSLPGETLDLIVDNILVAAQKHALTDKITAISADISTNINFCGLKG
jgi:hypothetical protein